MEIIKRKTKMRKRDSRGRLRKGKGNVKLLELKISIVPTWKDVAKLVRHSIEIEKVNRGNLKDVMCIAKESIRAVCEHGSEKHIQALENTLDFAKGVKSKESYKKGFTRRSKKKYKSYKKGFTRSRFRKVKK